MENAVLFFDDFAFVFDGISDCLFAETEGKKAAGGGSSEKIRENKRLRLVGGGSRSPEKPGPQIFCGHTQRKTVV